MFGHAPADTRHVADSAPLRHLASASLPLGHIATSTTPLRDTGVGCRKKRLSNSCKEWASVFPSRRKFSAIALQIAWKFLKAPCLLAWMMLQLPGNCPKSLPRQKNSVEVGWKPRKSGFLELPRPKISTRTLPNFSRQHFHAKKSRWKCLKPAPHGASTTSIVKFGVVLAVSTSRVNDQRRKITG